MNLSDHTSNSSAKKDLTKQAQDVLKILRNAGQKAERVTMTKLLEAWHNRGSKILRVSGLHPPDLSAVDCQRFLIHLLLGEILNEDFHFTPYSTISYLVPGLRADNVLNGNITVKMVTLDNDFHQVRNDLSWKMVNVYWFDNCRHSCCKVEVCAEFSVKLLEIQKLESKVKFERIDE